MKSLSNVIKSSSYISLDDARTIRAHIHNLQAKSREEHLTEPDAVEHEQHTQAKQLGEQILRDAEAQAELLIQQAREEIDRRNRDAEQSIETWWQQRREQDDEHIAQARSSGYETGLREGLEQAETQILEQYSDMIAEARNVVVGAHEMKEQILLEAEPFLLDLSCAIAAKIIGRQLTVTPEWTLQLIQGLLQRRRERGLITLCVSPAMFEYIQNNRDELMLALDSQAELQILPDSTVSDHGCVIRSSFGSIDGRIDSQLQEVKAALRQVAAQQQGGDPDD
jgi:flagellar assembly protein FliH